MAIDENGSCYSSIRVRPADDFSMIIDRMAHYVEGDASALRDQPGLWEMARWISIGADPAVAQELRIGLIEYLLGRGATQYLAIADMEVMAYAIRGPLWRFICGRARIIAQRGAALCHAQRSRRAIEGLHHPTCLVGVALDRRLLLAKGDVSAIGRYRETRDINSLQQHFG